MSTHELTYRLRRLICRLRLAAAAASLLLFAALLLPHVLSTACADYHHRLCRELTYALKPGGRLLGAIPREHAKTSLGTLALCLHEICLGEKKNILLVAASRREAEAKLRLISTELEGNLGLSGAFGPVIRPARDSKGQLVAYADGEIVLAGGVRISTIGFGGKVRGQLSGGRRLDLIILDDPEDDSSARSPMLRRKLREWCDQALLNALDVERGSIVWLGTLLHHDSVLAQWMAEQQGRPGWRVLRWSALSDEGEPLWPARWTKERLALRRQEIGERAFAQEYMNQPVSLSAQVIADSDWLIYDPALLRRTARGLCYGELPLTVAAGVDPAIGQGSEHDFFATVVLGFAEPELESGRPLIYVLDVIHRRMRFSAQLESLATLCSRWLPRAVGVESMAYQQALAEGLRELGLPVREIKSRGEKQRRIEASALHVQQGRVLLPAIAPWLAEWRAEAADFPAGAHDDQLDAFAFALAAGLPLTGHSPLTADSPQERLIDPFSGSGHGTLARF